MATAQAFTTYLSTNVLKHIFNNTAYSRPATVHVGLFSSAPSDAGGGTELTAAGYARVAATFGAASLGQIQNSAAATFAVAEEDWPSVTHAAIFDASTSGNMLAWGALTVPKTILDGGRITFPIGALKIAMYPILNGTIYMANKVLDLVFRNQAWTPPVTLYGGLFTAAPDQNGGGTEVSGGSYARVALAFDTASGETCVQGAQADFPTPSSGGGLWLPQGIFDAATSGNLLFWNSRSAMVVESGQQVSFAAAQLVAGID